MYCRHVLDRCRFPRSQAVVSAIMERHTPLYTYVLLAVVERSSEWYSVLLYSYTGIRTNPFDSCRRAPLLYCPFR